MIFDAAVAWLCAEFWLTRSPSPKKRETKKKKTGGGRRERKRSRQKEETALCLCQGLKGKTLASSHQELKQKQLINRARQIQSPCKLNTSPSSSFLSSNIPPPPNTFVFSLPSVFVTSLCVCVWGGGHSKYSTGIYLFLSSKLFRISGERVQLSPKIAFFIHSCNPQLNLFPKTQQMTAGSCLTHYLSTLCTAQMTGLTFNW